VGWAMKKALALILGVVFASSTVAWAATAAHVVIVVEENHGYSQVIGSSAMPFLNGLAKKYGMATNYYANGHPSIPNYFMLTAGETITYNDNSTGVFNGDNIVKHLLVGGKTWKVYAEQLPYVGYTGGNHLNYVRHHNPFVYFGDVVNSPVQRLNVVPFPQFQTDLASNSLPNYSFIVPDSLDDAHSASLAQADAWLKTKISPLLNNPEFKASGVLIIVFDEALVSDRSHGGGRVAMIVAGPNAILGSRFNGLVQHQSVLRLSCDLLGLTGCPGLAATAPRITGLTK
jgi:phosphatidylinositol-3-phosphatase